MEKAKNKGNDTIMNRTSTYCSVVGQYTNVAMRANGDFALAVLLKLLYMISHPMNSHANS